MQAVENALGGGEGIEGLYGSIGRTGTSRVLLALRDHCGLGPDSVLLDVGAGLGRPLLHALFEPGVRAISGIEVDPVKVAKAEAFGERVRARLRAKGLLDHEGEGGGRGASDAEGAAGTVRGGAGAEAAGASARRGVGTEAAREGCGGEDPADEPVTGRWRTPTFTCHPMEEAESLGEATHAYSFWEGVPTTARVAFGRLASASATLRGVAVIQRAMRGRDPASVMAEDWGFRDLKLRASFPVSMSGSGRSFTAYVFSRGVGESPDGAAGPRAAAVAASAAAENAIPETAPPPARKPSPPASAAGRRPSPAATPGAFAPEIPEPPVPEPAPPRRAGDHPQPPRGDPLTRPLSARELAPAARRTSSRLASKRPEGRDADAISEAARRPAAETRARGDLGPCEGSPVEKPPGTPAPPLGLEGWLGGPAPSPRKRPSPTKAPQFRQRKTTSGADATHAKLEASGPPVRRSLAVGLEGRVRQARLSHPAPPGISR